MTLHLSAMIQYGHRRNRYDNYKEFANLYNCNIQTLRYYDRIDLLKPVKVDDMNGYRYYEKEQAFDFVKIKNLQLANFTIEEIKILLDKSDQEIYEAFNLKIQQQKDKLARIIQIQESYLKEKKSMEKLIENMSDFIIEQLSNDECLKEFDLNNDDKEMISQKVRDYMNGMMKSSIAESNVSLKIDDEIVQGTESILEKIDSFNVNDVENDIILGNGEITEDDMFNPNDFSIVWENDGWKHVYEFINDIPKLKEDEFYAFSFRLADEKYRRVISFPMYMLGAILMKNDGMNIAMGCNIEESKDGINHFQLLLKN